MSRNKRFLPGSNITFLRLISICGLFTDSPTYRCSLWKRSGVETDDWDSGTSHHVSHYTPLLEDGAPQLPSPSSCSSHQALGHQPHSRFNCSVSPHSPSAMSRFPAICKMKRKVGIYPNCTLLLSRSLTSNSYTILSRLWVTIDGVWMDDSIYWPLIHTTLNYNLQITLTHRLVSSVY
jgi:hypothetical protein